MTGNTQTTGARKAPPSADDPRGIRECLLPEDIDQFDQEYRTAMAEATVSFNLSELRELLESWRRVAWLSLDPDRHRRMLEKARRINAGEYVHTVPWEEVRARLNLPPAPPAEPSGLASEPPDNRFSSDGPAKLQAMAGETPTPGARKAPPDADDPRGIRECLLPEDVDRFDEQYRKAMADATESMDLSKLHSMLEQWRIWAWSSLNPERHRRMVETIRRVQAGERVRGVPASEIVARLGL